MRLSLEKKPSQCSFDTERGMSPRFALMATNSELTCAPYCLSALEANLEPHTAGLVKPTILRFFTLSPGSAIHRCASGDVRETSFTCFRSTKLTRGLSRQLVATASCLEGAAPWPLIVPSIRSSNACPMPSLRLTSFWVESLNASYRRTSLKFKVCAFLSRWMPLPSFVARVSGTSKHPLNSSRFSESLEPWETCILVRLQAATAETANLYLGCSLAVCGGLEVALQGGAFS
eukprot:1180616-Rhodomonas_salina.1